MTKTPKPGKAETIAATDDARTKNTLRHSYRVLSDSEKRQMDEIKDIGQAFLDLCDRLPQGRALSISRTKIEEAVMWAVKGLTE
ncbi:hypothetical protein CFI11_09800 [Thalassococcus sp. S3]|nr:hypothetical protein CFI11_09800 [Thalassococcus sp. S3]